MEYSKIDGVWLWKLGYKEHQGVLLTHLFTLRPLNLDKISSHTIRKEKNNTVFGFLQNLWGTEASYK